MRANAFARIAEVHRDGIMRTAIPPTIHRRRDFCRRVPAIDGGKLSGLTLIRRGRRAIKHPDDTAGALALRAPCYAAARTLARQPRTVNPLL